LRCKRDEILESEGVKQKMKQTLMLSEKEKVECVWIERDGEGRMCRLSKSVRGENSLLKSKKGKLFYAG
jgi:hypothetical protein